MNSSFNPRTVLALVLFGALSFAALLWFIGKGDTGPGPDNGEAHAGGHGLTGYAGLAAMLGKQGYDVSLSRSRGQLDDEALLVLTPPIWADGEKIAQIIKDRRYTGPTLLILPKWYAFKLPLTAKGAKRGWGKQAIAACPEPTRTLRLLGKLFQQDGLTYACLTGNEDEPALSATCLFRVLAQRG